MVQQVWPEVRLETEAEASWLRGHFLRRRGIRNDQW